MPVSHFAGDPLTLDVLFALTPGELYELVLQRKQNALKQRL